MKNKVWLALGIVCSICWLSTLAPAQIGGGTRTTVSPPGSIGARGAIRGRGGLRGRDINPNFNPPGSLSAIERFTPRGSTNPAYNLNPQGSIFRPRSAAPNGTSHHRRGKTSRYSAARPSVSGVANGGQARALQGDAPLALANVRLLKRELSRYENGRDWIEALQLNEVTKILQDGNVGDLTAEQRETLDTTSNRLEQLTSDPCYDVVTQLHGFGELAKQLSDLQSAHAANAPAQLAAP